MFVDPLSGSGARTTVTHNTLACNKIQKMMFALRMHLTPSDMCAGKMPLSYQRNIVIYAGRYRISSSLRKSFV